MILRFQGGMMNETQIEAHLRLISEHLIIVLGEDIPLDKACFAGGCIRDLWRNKPPKDYDVFFFDLESAQRTADFFTTLNENLYVNKSIVSAKRTHLGNWDVVFKISDILYVVQFIICNTNPIETLVASFDFTINTSYFDIAFSQLTLSDATKRNTLELCEKTNKPFAALCRVPKFIKEGYEISNHTLAAIVTRISGAELSASDLDEDGYGDLIAVSNHWTRGDLLVAANATPTLQVTPMPGVRITDYVPAISTPAVEFFDEMPF